MISISILNIRDNENKIRQIDNLNPSFIHLDIMDGNFVNNKVDLLDLPKLNSKKDIHLMVNNIKAYIDMYKNYKPEYITFHLEATNNIDEIIKYIKNLNIKVGISIKPNTSVKSLLPYLDKLDLVLVMSVEPGAGGQKFIDSSTNKIKELYQLREKNNYNYVIEVDGGVNFNTKDKCEGADILVVGSYITMSDNIYETYNNML